MRSASFFLLGILLGCLIVTPLVPVILYMMLHRNPKVRTDD